MGPKNSDQKRDECDIKILDRPDDFVRRRNFSILETLMNLARPEIQQRTSNRTGIDVEEQVASKGMPKREFSSG